MMIRLDSPTSRHLTALSFCHSISSVHIRILLQHVIAPWMIPKHWAPVINVLYHDSLMNVKLALPSNMYVFSLGSAGHKDNLTFTYRGGQCWLNISLHTWTMLFSLATTDWSTNIECGNQFSDILHQMKLAVFMSWCIVFNTENISRKIIALKEFFL